MAIVTADLERFIEFHARVFEVELIFRETTPHFQHAILRAGARSWLHPAELAENAHAHASAEMFARGHIDHLALSASSVAAFERIRTCLVQAGASEGVIDDLGAFHALWFTDPDGMRGEVSLIVDPTLREFHAPRAI